MSGRARLFTVALVGCGLVLAPAGRSFGKRLILNTTASVPLGFYWLSDSRPGVGELALVRPPRDLAHWMAARHYLPLNVPLIKRIAAVGGQEVCIGAGAVFIDEEPVAEVLKRDRLGRRLSAANLCRHLRRDEVFLLNAEPRSLDSRYFGPLTGRSVVGKLIPLWTWKR